MKLIKIFDYFFFRVYSFFKERGDFAPDTKGSLILATAQFLFILNIFNIFELLFELEIMTGKYDVLPIIIVLGVINWYRYEKRMNIEELVNKWQGENKSRKIFNGWLIILYLIITFSTNLLHGMIKNGQI